MDIDELHKLANARILKNSQSTDQAFQEKTLANDYFPIPPDENIIPDVSVEERILASQIEAEMKANEEDHSQKIAGDSGLVE